MRKGVISKQGFAFESRANRELPNVFLFVGRSMKRGSGDLMRTIHNAQVECVGREGGFPVSRSVHLMHVYSIADAQT